MDLRSMEVEEDLYWHFQVFSFGRLIFNKHLLLPARCFSKVIEMQHGEENVLLEWSCASVQRTGWQEMDGNQTGSSLSTPAVSFTCGMLT